MGLDEELAAAVATYQEALEVFRADTSNAGAKQRMADAGAALDAVRERLPRPEPMTEGEIVVEPVPADAGAAVSGEEQ